MRAFDGPVAQQMIVMAAFMAHLNAVLVENVEGVYDCRLLTSYRSVARREVSLSIQKTSSSH